MSFQPGQTVRWASSLRDDDWPSIDPEPPVYSLPDDWAPDDPEYPVYRLNPVGRVLKVGISRDPNAKTYCGVCGPPASRCPGPFVLVDFWGGTEGMVYAEHELEPA